jgi:hypothetical protein
MGKLSLNDLTKPSKRGGIRLDVLIDKIKNKEPIEMSNGHSKILKWTSKAIETSAKKKDFAKLKGQVLQDASKKLYVLSNLEKTSEFGGAGGSGAGAEVTALTESAQCLYLAYAVNVLKANIPESKRISKKELEPSMKYCKVSDKFDDMYAKVSEDWQLSCIRGANELRKVLSGTDFEYHRGSSIVGRIENHFKVLNRKEKVFSNVNKWSPADIYIFKKSQIVPSMAAIEKSTTIKALNDVILTLYKKKQLFPVSLKKIGGQASIKVLNETETTEKYKFVEYKLGTFFDSKDAYIQYGGLKDVIQLRTFSAGLSGFQGEIKGQYANQGKVGYGIIQFICQANGTKRLPDQQHIAQLIKRLDKNTLVEFYNLAKQYGVKGLPKTTKAWLELMAENPLEWIFSKYMSMRVLDAILSKSDRIQDKIITSLYLYASSRSEYSAVYLKVS